MMIDDVVTSPATCPSQSSYSMTPPLLANNRARTGENRYKYPPLTHKPFVSFSSLLARSATASFSFTYYGKTSFYPVSLISAYGPYSFISSTLFSHSQNETFPYIVLSTTMKMKLEIIQILKEAVLYFFYSPKYCHFYNKRFGPIIWTNIKITQTLEKTNNFLVNR